MTTDHARATTMIGTQPGRHGTFRRLCACAAIAGAAVATVGCHRGGPPRVEVHGRVAIDGRPLPWGAIYFRPEFGVAGPSAAGRIENGVYRIEAEDGPAVGRLRVEIRTVSDVDASQDIRRSGPPREIVEVPARYRQDPILVVESELGGPNEFDFDLASGE